MPTDDNAELWNSVLAKVPGSPSVFDLIYGAEFIDSSSNENVGEVTFHASQLAGKTEKVNPKTFQRRILGYLTDNLDVFQSQACDQKWSVEDLHKNKALVVPEVVLVQACTAAEHLNGDHMEIVTTIVFLPTICQLSYQLSHPCYQSLVKLVQQQPALMVAKCLAPALQFSNSVHTSQLIAKLLPQLPLVLLPHLALLMRSLTDRSDFEEGDLLILEAACAIVPRTPTAPAGVTEAVRGITAALQIICRALPANSSKVGRTLLYNLHKLSSHLAMNPDLKNIFRHIIEEHTSPLQRPIKAQLDKIH